MTDAIQMSVPDGRDKTIGTADTVRAGGGDEHGARYVAGLHASRAAGITNGVKSRGAATLSASEQRSFDYHLAESDKLMALATELGARSANVRAIAAEFNLGAGSERTQFSVGSGPGTYRQGDPHGPNWMRDLVAFGLRGDQGAAARLQRNNDEVRVEHRALTTTDTAGGDFVPPLWAMNQFVALARAQRVTANLVRNEVLPTGTDSLNVPKMLTGTAVAEQATQNTAVQNTDATTSTVTAGVSTLSGQQVVAVQLLEQSPINIGDMLLQDLIADLAAKTDLFVLSNNAATKKGLLIETGTNSIVYTDATPTAAELFSKLADARLQVEVGRFASPDAIIMHPRRWAWLLAQGDTVGRPLVVPDASGPYNALGNSSGTTDPATGRVGTVLGLPVYVDPLIPTNLGAGTNEDRIIVLKTDDSVLYEGAINAEAFREPLAANLSVLLRVYRYAAFTTARQPKSVSVVAGTGLVTPVL